MMQIITNMEIKELTKAEEEIMQVLWNLGKAFVKDILAKLPEPKPAYNTVSTIVRILEQKGFVAFEAFGKTHQYYTKVSKTDYTKFATNKIKNSFFGNSASAMMSFFIENEQIDLKELDEILKIIEARK